jgi:hypothetical protein
MMCTECRATAYPDTVLEGSDLVEMLAWLCGAAPGWLYCGWRHMLRIKVCAACGSRALVREARAAAAWDALRAPEPREVRVCNLSGPVRWPPTLGTPRARLREGGVGALLCVTLLAAWALGAALPVAMLASVWWIYAIVRVAQLRAGASACRAWDGAGRELRIELI